MTKWQYFSDGRLFAIFAAVRKNILRADKYAYNTYNCCHYSIVIR